MRAGLYGRTIAEDDRTFVKAVVFEMAKTFSPLYVQEKYYACLKENLDELPEMLVLPDGEKIADKIEVLFTIGGDGTILDTVSMLRNTQIPVMGINTGRLGFLTSAGKGEVQIALRMIAEGNFHLDGRTVLQLDSSPALFEESPFALNEFTILKKESSSMITVHTFVDDVYLNSYWADGLIIATPTGSTGYSLSCGGPILHPGSSSFVITPVAPHNLTVRPLVISDDKKISFEVTGRSDKFLSSMDSRYDTFDALYRLSVKKAKFKFQMLRLNDYSFLHNIRMKMMWGADQRNWEKRY